MLLLKHYLGLIWGFFMIYQDINTYILYVLLLLSAPDVINCSDFLKYYTTFSLITTIITGVFSPISGWLVDYFNQKQMLQLIIITMSHLIVFSSQFLSLIDPDNAYNWVILCILYQVFQVITIQNNNILWKIIKNYIEETHTHLNSSPYIMQPTVIINDDQKLLVNEDDIMPIIKTNNTLSVVNRIGNIGDLTSDISESIIIGSLALILLYLKESWITIRFILWYLSMFLCIINILATIIITFIYRRSKLRKNVLNNSSDTEPLLDNNNENNENNENNLNKININKLSYYRYFIIAIKDFYNNKIVFHAMWHCILLSMFISLIQYPLTYSELDYFIQTNSTPDLANFCGAELINLILVGAVTNISYLCGSIFYAFFIVNARSTIFYQRWYPAACLIIIGCTIALLYTLPSYMVIILISISQIIPYYLTYYDYYLFTEYANSKFYGFILGIYGISSTIVTVLMQLLYLINIPYGVLIGLGITLLIINFAYSYYLAYLCSKIS